MAEFTHEEMEQMLSLLRDIAQANREVVTQLEKISGNILEVMLVTKIMLSLRSDELRERKIAFFMGKTGPKRRLIDLYLSIGDGKTRGELINADFPKGTVWRYCPELVSESLLRKVGVRVSGEEVLGYTFIEEATQLSQHLKKLLQPS